MKKIALILSIIMAFSILSLAAYGNEKLNYAAETQEEFFRVRGKLYGIVGYGEFTIYNSDNFEGAKVTPSYSVNIEIDIGELNWDMFLDFSSSEFYYVDITIKHLFDNRYLVTEFNGYADESELEEKEHYSKYLSNDKITVFLDGKELEFDVDPIIVNGRTLVPLRTIFEALGAEVLWDGEEQKVTAYRGPATVILWINSTNMYLNGANYTIDSMPVIKDDRTLIPLRAVSEAFNCNVEWLAESKTVVITSNDSVEDLKGMYRIAGRFYPTTLPEGEFLILSTDNFEGKETAEITNDRIKVSIEGLDTKLFYNDENGKSYFVFVVVKDCGDGTYRVVEYESRLFLPEDDD